MSDRQKLDRNVLGLTGGLPLEASSGGIEELRKDIQRLMDMEAIRQLKHAYFRCIDSANFEELATLFHEDVSVHFTGGTYEWKLQGRDAYLEAVQKSFHTQAIGHHNGHHPEIQMLSETEARGCWYLADNMWILSGNVFTTGTALYWDRYLKVDGRWVIKDTRYERLYEITEQQDGNPPITSHYLGAHGSRVE